MRVQPRAGVLIRDPATKQIVAAEGVTVPDDSLFWARRVRDGDAIVVASPAVSPPKPTATRRKAE